MEIQAHKPGTAFFMEPNLSSFTEKEPKVCMAKESACRVWTDLTHMLRGVNFMLHTGMATMTRHKVTIIPNL